MPAPSVKVAGSDLNLNLKTRFEMTTIRAEAKANPGAEARAFASNSVSVIPSLTSFRSFKVDLAKIKARDLHNGHGKPEREAIRSLQSSEILTSMIGKSGGAIVKN